jgi:hypothetical protein
MFITPKIRESPLAKRKSIAEKEIPLRVCTRKNSIVNTFYSWEVLFMASEESGGKVGHMCRESTYAYNSQKIRSLFCKPFVK